MYMITMYDSFGTVWIDLENPSKEELAGIQERYGIHPIVLAELAEPSLRSKVDLYPHYAYMIFRFPSIHVNKEVHETEEREVDFVIGKDFLITAHYVPIEPLYLMGKLMETGALLNKEHTIEHAGYLFYAIMRRLYQAAEDDLFHLRSHIKRIEEAIFRGEERRMVEDISKLNRILINFWWSTRAHAELLDSFEIVAKSFWGESFNYYIRSLSGEYLKIDKRIDGNKEVLKSLKETNDSLLSTKTNQTMKALTVLTAALLPASILVNLFGMKTSNEPFIGMQNDFWIVIGMTVALSALTMAYFKARRWI